jgi:uncharacterized protein (DUF885 family)
VQSTVQPADSLAEVARQYWEKRLAQDPLFATLLGDRRFDDRLPDITPAGRTQRETEFESTLNDCAAISESGLSEADMLTLTALLVDARGALDYSHCRLEEWTLDPLQGPQVEFANVESYQPVRTPAQGQALIRRWTAMAKFFDDHMANLRRGASEGKVAIRICVEKVVDELEGFLAKPESELAFLRPLEVPHPGWLEYEKRQFSDGLTAAVHDSIRPAYAKYMKFLVEEILPKARPEHRPGIGHLPGGAENYSRLIRVHTSLDLTPEELHNTGLSQVARINEEMELLGEKVFGIRDRKQILKKLRTDPALYFHTRDEVAEKAEAALSRAKAAISEWFGRLPKAECEVVRMSEYEEKHSTIAYYRQPASDGSRPGRYYINTYAPETRPRYEAEALAYHESIPGHHLQIAIAQELQGIPEFRKNSGVTAFIEGWGLYSERLADEMGLYSSDLDRIGVLSYDSWRACRLVVDTGMHALGWTRAQAIAFMLENTALAENNIVNEVDRYITWPGQALAYKTGQLEMMRLRDEAKVDLGEKFAIKDFHDALLENGAIPLEALRQVLSRYSEGQRKLD